MTIDGINISTFGLQLSYLGDYFNQPARKKILEEQGFAAKDIVFDGKETTIYLFGMYESKADMLDAIEAFYTLIRSSLVHTYILSGHNITFTGIINEGVKVDVTRTLAKLTFKVNITA